MVNAAFVLLLMLFSVVLSYGLASIRRLLIVKRELDKVKIEDPDFSVKMDMITVFSYKH